MKTIPDINAFIAALAADTKAALETKSAKTLAALEDRRHQLLAHQLGFEPRQPIEPITVIGDSHTLFFAGEDGLNQVKHRRVGFWRPRYITRGLDLLPCFQTRHLGPATAWRAFDYGASTRAREKLDALVRSELKPGARVLLSLGEIDCRCHIPKAVLTGTAPGAAVRGTVERLLRLAKHLAAHDLKVAIWGPALVTSQTATLAGHPLPMVGAFGLRAEVARAFSVELQAQGAAQNIPCVNLAGTYHPWDQPAAADCFCDGFHLAQRMMPRALKALLDTQVVSLQTDSTQSISASVGRNRL